MVIAGIAARVAGFAGRAIAAKGASVAAKGAAKALKKKKLKTTMKKVGKGLAVGSALVGAGYLIEKGAEKLGVRGGAGFIGKRPGSGKRRKGKVPKAVKKWATRITSRRKQEERIVKDLFGAEGGKIIKKPKKAYSQGVITQSEAMRALRN